jgi:hypothetical protein
MFRTPLLAGFCLPLLALVACGDGTAESPTAAKNDACLGRPADSVADYRQKLSRFVSAPGFAPSFKQGEVLDDEQPIAITVSEPGFGDGLGYRISYLANCSVYEFHSGNLYPQPDGHWTGTLQTGTGADIPDGTPAFIEIVRTRLLPSEGMSLPKAVTSTVGEYAVRINPPRR